ncbi:unnamed protein product [Onchocerca ochengi]|uniref:Ground-like domain-containing protein n=1 Tax=Onchocerca ochengi TaxID=42157 RepID=A0A182DXX1_ONCOC|nr:unnamed protein product [Onchocerca ochengi]
MESEEKSVLYGTSTYGYNHDDSSQSLNRHDKEKSGHDAIAPVYYHNNTPHSNDYSGNQYDDSSNNQNGIYNSNRYENYWNLDPSNCSDYAQRRINSCAYMLMKLDAFQQTVGKFEKFTMSNIFRNSRDEFLDICDAYNLYNGCIGNNSIKELCYSEEPFRSRYASIDKSLSYACGEGYPSLFTNWYCIQEVASSVIYMECINIVGVGHYDRQKMDNYQILPNSLSTCSSLQTYIHCIRALIEDRCGRHAYLAVLMTTRRSGETLFPYCTLAAMGYTSSVTLQVISTIISHLFLSTLS